MFRCDLRQLLGIKHGFNRRYWWISLRHYLSELLMNVILFYVLYKTWTPLLNNNPRVAFLNYGVQFLKKIMINRINKSVVIIENNFRYILFFWDLLQLIINTCMIWDWISIFYRLLVFHIPNKHFDGHTSSDRYYLIIFNKIVRT